MIDIAYLTSSLSSTNENIFNGLRNRVPFKVLEFTKALGIGMYVKNIDRNFFSILKTLIGLDGNDFLASIYQNTKNIQDWSIVLKCSNSKIRNRFLVAMLLGYYFSTTETNVVITKARAIIDGNKKYPNEHAELIVGEFAAELLVPSVRFDEMYIGDPENADMEIDSLARTFDVSTGVIKFKIDSKFQHLGF